MNTQNLSIVSGPSVALLNDAFRYAYSKEARIKPTITVKDIRGAKYKIVLERIVGMMYEDGSGHSFIITAYANGVLVKFYYNAEKRIGNFFDK